MKKTFSKALALIFTTISANALTASNKQTTKNATRQIQVMLADESQVLGLFDAINNKQSGKVISFLKKGADIDEADQNGVTPLIVATNNGKTEIVRLLLENGADIDKADKNGFTALIADANKGNKEIAELLLKHGADVNKANKKGAAPLMLATLNGNIEIVRLLLENDVDINTADKIGATPLILATFIGDIKIVKLLLEKGVDINTADIYGKTPLLAAIGKNNTEIAKLLLKKGVDIDTADQDGTTPLIFAVDNGNTEIVRLLLEKGADPDKTDKYGNTALIGAADKGNKEIAELLLKHGADVNKTRQDGVTPLIYAVDKGDTEIVRLLLENGVDANKAGRDGINPLIVAVDYGNKEIVRLLLENGVDANKAGRDGATPLIVAVDKGYTEIVRLLLENGVDANKIIGHGVTAIKIARNRGFNNIVRLLQDHGADPHDKKGENSEFYTLLYTALTIITIGSYRKITSLWKDGKEAENKLKQSKKDIISEIRELLKMSLDLEFNLDEQKNILSLNLTSFDKKQKDFFTKIINSNNKNKFFIVSKKSITISLNESDKFCPYERDGNKYQIKKDFKTAPDSIKQSIAARKLANQKGVDLTGQQKLVKTLPEQIQETRSQIETQFKKIKELEKKLENYEKNKNDNTDKIKASLCNSIRYAISDLKELKELDANSDHEKNDKTIADLEKKLTSYEASQANTGAALSQANYEVSEIQIAEAGQNIPKDPADQNDSNGVASQEDPDQEISGPLAIKIQEALTLSYLKKYYEALLKGTSQESFIMTETAQKDSNSSNPLMSDKAKQFIKETLNAFKEPTKKAAAKQNKEELNQEKEKFHNLLDLAVQNVKLNSHQLPQGREDKTIRSLIYAFLCHCTGDKESVKEAYIKLVNEGQKTGSYTGSGHASGNTIENLQALQEVLQHFIASDKETSIFQAANHNDLMEFLEKHKILARDSNPEQSHIVRLEYDIPKDPQEYVTDLVKEIIFSKEISAKDDEFKNKVKKEIEEFIKCNKLLLDFVEKNKENEQVSIMSEGDDITDDITSFLEQDKRENFKELRRIIEISLNKEEQGKEVAKSFGTTTFSDFKSKLEDIYKKEEERIKNELQDREIGR